MAEDRADGSGGTHLRPASPSSRKDALAWLNCLSLEVCKPQQGRPLLEVRQKDPWH